MINPGKAMTPASCEWVRISYFLQEFCVWGFFLAKMTNTAWLKLHRHETLLFCLHDCELSILS